MQKIAHLSDERNKSLWNFESTEPVASENDKHHTLVTLVNTFFYTFYILLKVLSIKCN